MKLVIRWRVSTLVLFAATYLIPGIRMEDPYTWMIYTMISLSLGWIMRLSALYSNRCPAR